MLYANSAAQMKTAYSVERLLITGGAGFIGSNFVHTLIERYPQSKPVILDALTYAGNLDNLKQILPRIHFVQGDINNKELISLLIKQYQITGIIHFAAESHVDRSILDPGVFVATNVNGTLSLLNIAKKFKLERFLQVSTDEVYGSLGASGYFTEETPLSPNSPYSASKASADMLVRAYHHTYGMDVITTRCSNNYGPYQFPEKLIPLMITRALANQKLPVYGDGLNVRDWLHVKDHCMALLLVYQQGKSGEIYNVGGHNEWKNINIVKLILKYLNKDESLIEYVQDRLGHDRRYAIDAAKIERTLGFKPSYTFEQGIEETIQWYLENQFWCERIKTGDYLNQAY